MRTSIRNALLAGILLSAPMTAAPLERRLTPEMPRETCGYVPTTPEREFSGVLHEARPSPGLVVKRETYFVRGETVRVYKVSHTSARGTFTLLYDPTEHISITYAPGRTDEFESFVDLDVLPDNNYRLLLDVVPPEKAGYGKGTFLVDTRQPADGIISRALHLDTLAARITQETHALAAWDGCTQFPLDLERYHDLFTGITPIVKPLLYDYKGGAQRAATGTLERTKELIDKLFTRP